MDADLAPLLRIPPPPGPDQGWPADLSLNQPEFESALRGRAQQLPALTTALTTELVGYREVDGGVVADLRDADGLRSVRARYLVGCDGANSVVREHGDFTIVDADFTADWLVVDICSAIPREWTADVSQVCDPARPTTCVASGPGRRRFEFMRLPHENSTDIAHPERVWELLARWGYRPDNAELEKSAIYTFRARWVRHWQQGNVLLAGDAAHQMPPMGGVGMVSGIRDAANLAWKLDFVLAGFADAALVETYSSERSAHLQSALQRSVGWGRLVCESDPATARSRDQRLRRLGVDALPDTPAEVLGAGAFPAREDCFGGALIGTPGVQGALEFTDAERVLADRRNPGRVTVLLDGTRVDVAEAAALAARIPTGSPIDVWLVLSQSQVPYPLGGVDVATDLDGTYAERFARTGAIAEVLRPDHYVFGATARISDAEKLVDVLPEALALRTPFQARTSQSSTVAEAESSHAARFGGLR